MPLFEVGYDHALENVIVSVKTKDSRKILKTILNGVTHFFGEACVIVFLLSKLKRNARDLKENFSQGRELGEPLARTVLT